MKQQIAAIAVPVYPVRRSFLLVILITDEKAQLSRFEGNPTLPVACVRAPTFVLASS